MQLPPVTESISRCGMILPLQTQYASRLFLMAALATQLDNSKVCAVSVQKLTGACAWTGNAFSNSSLTGGFRLKQVKYSLSEYSLSLVDVWPGPWTAFVPPTTGSLCACKPSCYYIIPLVKPLHWLPLSDTNQLQWKCSYTAKNCIK